MSNQPHDGRPSFELPQLEAGTVAQEAARLVEAFGGWARAAAAGGAADHASTTDAPAEPGSGARSRHDHDHESDHDHDHDPESDPEPEFDPEADRRTPEVCANCGAARGVGRSASCQVCPVCQGIALLRAVRPETIDRLADLAGWVAASLRDVAEHQRDGRTQQTRTPPEPPATGSGGAD